jgi:hypothetical protein
VTVPIQSKAVSLESSLKYFTTCTTRARCAISKIYTTYTIGHHSGWGEQPSWTPGTLNGCTMCTSPMCILSAKCSLVIHVGDTHPLNVINNPFVFMIFFFTDWPSLRLLKNLLFTRGFDSDYVWMFFPLLFITLRTN